MVIWVMKIFFCIVLLCILATSSYYLLLLLNPYHFCPLLCHLCMKFSPGVSLFLEDISSLSHSVVFLHFFPLIAEVRQLRLPLSVAGRNYPISEVRGRSWEDPMPEGWRPRGVTPHLRSGSAAKTARLQWHRNG